MKSLFKIVWIGVVIVGIVTVAASIIVPMLPSSAPTLEEPVALIGADEEYAQALLEEVYGLDNHGLWTALGIAGGILTVIGAVPLVWMWKKQAGNKNKKTAK